MFTNNVQTISFQEKWILAIKLNRAILPQENANYPQFLLENGIHFERLHITLLDQFHLVDILRTKQCTQKTAIETQKEERAHIIFSFHL